MGRIVSSWGRNIVTPEVEARMRPIEESVAREAEALHT
jgi:hypothetical protein